MTVVIAIACTDGLVVAGDSRTTLYTEPMRVLSDYTHKVFDVGGHAVATYGYGYLLDRNIAGNMTEFQTGVAGAGLSTEALAGRLADFFADRFDRHIAEHPNDQPADDVVALGFLVAGMAEGRGKVYEVTLPQRDVVESLDQRDRPGALWRGQTDVIARLVMGCDVTSLAQAAAAEGKMGSFEDLLPLIRNLEYYMPFQMMNLQDAVDYAIFAIRTTIDVQRLTYGTMNNPGSWPGVGGPIEVAVITPSEPLRWLQRTELQGERKAGEAESL